MNTTKENSITIEGVKHLLVEGYENCEECSLSEPCAYGYVHFCDTFARYLIGSNTHLHHFVKQLKED